MPQLSVIVTSYNIEKYLAGCLDTVINQTLRDIEIIVVDDGSTDGTPEIIRDYAKKDPRIKPILLPENTVGGVASPANAGLDAATGTYIGFADGDDYLELDMFEKLVAAAEANGSDLAMCKYRLVDETGAQKPPAEKNRWDRFPTTEHVELDDDAKTIEILRFIAVPWRKIYRRELIEANHIRFPVVDYFWEDNPFHWFSVCAAADIVVVPEVLCYHRVGRVGQTMATRDAGLLKMFGHYQTIRDWLAEKGLLDRFQVTLLAWAISQFEWIHKRLPEDSGVPLYDTMARIVRPVDEDVYVAALADKSAKTAEILQYVRDADRPSFLTTFGKQFAAKKKPAARAAASNLKPKLSRAGQLMQKGRENLRKRGFRDTFSKVMRRMSKQNKLLRRISRADHATVSEKHLLAYLAILQRDIERKHDAQMDRLQAIENELREIRSKQKTP